MVGIQFSTVGPRQIELLQIARYRMSDPRPFPLLPVAFGVSMVQVPHRRATTGDGKASKVSSPPIIRRRVATIDGTPW